MNPEESNIMSLRDHLLAAQASHPPPAAEIHHPLVAHDQHIDPQIAGYTPQVAGPSSSMSPDSHDRTPKSNKGPRVLADSKRAAQNRQAQRAFRQRKEAHIQSLKDQVKDREESVRRVQELERENGALREYVITLQHQLLSSGNNDLPAPPALLNFNNLTPETALQQAAMTPYQSQLQQAAAAAAERASEIGIGNAEAAAQLEAEAAAENKAVEGSSIAASTDSNVN